MNVPGTGGAGSQEEVGLQGCHHGEGRVLDLVGHGENGLMILLKLLVQVEVRGPDIIVHEPGGEGGHLGDLVTLGRSSVKVHQGAVSLAAAATLVLGGEIDHDVGGEGPVLIVQVFI